MLDRTTDIPGRIFLPIGGIHCATIPTAISTVLGSCVSVCLYDRGRGVGGMNHFHMPRSPDASKTGLRYGDASLDALLAEMAALGCAGEDLVAKVFGGAAMFGAPGGGVGGSNVRFALDYLRDRGIPVVAARTGGVTGSHLQLFSATGEVLVRRVSRLEGPR